MTSAAEALRVAAAVGPYFVWEPWSAGGGWRPWADLTDPDVIADRVEVTRRALSGVAASGAAGSAVAPRVAASVMFLGLASRLVSPPLGALVLTGVLPAARLWWRPVPGGPWPIAYRDAEPAPAGSFAATTVDGLVAPVLRVFRERFALSPRVLWGNLASAVAGAAGLLADREPRVAERAAAVLADALDRPPLAGTGTLVHPDPGHGRRFLVRRSCCLYYRVPGGGLCGDCVLMADADRRRHWHDARARYGK